MHHIRRSTFFLGFLIASLVALIIWYYQKSTSAEDGALDVLDRYQKSQLRVRDLEEQLTATPNDRTKDANGRKDNLNATSPAEQEADDLQQIPGIGPTFASRLAEDGITTYSRLSQMTADELRAIVGNRADVEQWIADAAGLTGG
jgi:predicted flap endonuclease-1-like 5' DNA nuclease